MDNFLVQLAYTPMDGGWEHEEMVIPATNAYAAMDIFIRNWKTELETAQKITDLSSRPMRVAPPPGIAAVIGEARPATEEDGDGETRPAAEGGGGPGELPTCAICGEGIGWDEGRAEFDTTPGVVSHADCVEQVGAIEAMRIHRQGQMRLHKGGKA